MATKKKNAGPRSVRKTMKRLKKAGHVVRPRKSRGPYKRNPAPVKGRKSKGGGRTVSLKGFTGTITRTRSGQVIIRGKGRK